MLIPLNQILITDRQRLEMDENHIENLMASFKDIGQVQAVLVSTYDGLDAGLLGCQWSWQIIAGATRCTAALRLGWTHIRADVVSPEHASDTARLKAEYVENALRKDLPWQDSCLALAKLNSAISNDKALVGERWTERMLATYTGYSHVNMHYMLVVADMLKVEPRDEELWNKGGFMEAFQLHLARQDRTATLELERRRQAMITHEDDSSEQLAESDDEDESSEEGDVKSLNTTDGEQAIEKVKVCIYGNVKPKEGAYSLIIANYETISIEAQGVYLKDPGYIILTNIFLSDWEGCKAFAKSLGFFPMPFPIVWDKQELIPQTAWPFVPNSRFCMVLEKKTAANTLWPNPATSIVSSFPILNSDQLPLAVVNHFTSTLCTPGEPVLNPDCSAIDALLELGHTPVWQEPDEEKFRATFERIKKWYETNVPGCEVVV